MDKFIMAEEVNGDISLTEDNIQILSQGDLHTETCHLLALETSKEIVVEGSTYGLARRPKLTDRI